MQLYEAGIDGYIIQMKANEVRLNVHVPRRSMGLLYGTETELF